MIPIDSITTVLDAVILADITRGDLISAGTHSPAVQRRHPPGNRFRLGVDELFTYDAEPSHERQRLPGFT